MTAIAAVIGAWSLTDAQTAGTSGAQVPNVEAIMAANTPVLAPVSAMPAVATLKETTPAEADAATAATTAMSDKMAKIHSGIQNILQAGSNLLVSHKTLSVGKGDTLMDILVRNKVPKNEAHEAIAALSKVYNPRDLNTGHAITVFFHQDPSLSEPAFSGMEIQQDTVKTVVVNKEDNGSYKAGSHEKEVNRETKAYRGTINSSLYVSAKAAGVPDGVILDLIKMYSWNVDFQRDLHAGDKFEVMYDQYKTVDGDIVPGKGVISYAKLTINNSEMPYYRYEDRSGDVAYYDGKGQSAKKSLMKTPIDGARISSGFGVRRHPVLGYSKMHKGIDFAAPTGTPIYAAGEGKIVKMGPFSSYGNYIRIKHSNGIETAYAHMKGFKAGLRSGARVKQGEVIGYVGTTGRSTGAHLHYEILVNNKHVNPNSIKLPTGTALAGRDLAAFKAFVGQTDRQFDKIDSDAPAVSLNVKPVVKTAAVKTPAKSANR